MPYAIPDCPICLDYACHHLTSFRDSYWMGEFRDFSSQFLFHHQTLVLYHARKVFAVSGGGGIRGALMRVMFFLHLFSSLENTHFDFKNMCGFFPLPCKYFTQVVVWWFLRFRGDEMLN